MSIRQTALHVCQGIPDNLPCLGINKMLKKLICIIFSACMLYTVPAHAVSTKQLQDSLVHHMTDKIATAVHKECINYNAMPPENIEIFVSILDKEHCGIILDIKGGCDPRVVTVIADMVAVETSKILPKLGLSEKKMQQTKFFIMVIPVTKNSMGRWVAYDASLLYWDGTTPKLDWEPAHKVQAEIDNS